MAGIIAVWLVLVVIGLTCDAPPFREPDDL